MNEIIVPYRPRPQMLAYHETKKRFRVNRIHRRFGKTVASINQKIKNANTDPKIIADERGLKYDANKLREWRNTPRLSAYIAPYHNQAKSLAWDALKYYASPFPGVVFNESELRADFPGGGRVRLFGADNIQALRGFKFWDVDLDEFQDQHPESWKEVLLPAGLELQAPFTFWGTNKGRDHLWQLYDEHKDDPDWFTLLLRASETGVLDPEFLEKERKLQGDELYMQEYELSDSGAIQGQIFGKELAWLYANGHVGKFEWDDSQSVDTYWDLGINDYLVVHFVQNKGSLRYVIDCMAVHGEAVKDVCKKLKSFDYEYGKHYLPHDSKQRDKITGESTYDYILANMPGQVELVQRPLVKGDHFDAFRATYTKLYINEKLLTFLRAIEQYKRPYDREKRVYLQEPKHDWTSHYADAMMQITAKLHEMLLESSGYGTITAEAEKKQQPEESYFHEEGGLII